MRRAFTQSFQIEGKDFVRAGRASAEIKTLLKSLGIDPAIIRRVAIVTYEAEMNVVMYARRGTLTFGMTPGAITITMDDEGPGIPDIPLAMREGYSTATPEIREMGFGAGMGLPNIQRNADELKIQSAVSRGTRLDITIRLN